MSRIEASNRHQSINNVNDHEFQPNFSIKLGAKLLAFFNLCKVIYNFVLPAKKIFLLIILRKTELFA